MAHDGPAIRRYRSIDDYLGPASGRFFGGGYRRVTYRLHTSERSRGAGEERLRATAAIAYPADWSRKATATPLKPHLSTLDALIVGAESVRPAGWLRRVDIRAGALPYEEGLDRVPIDARVQPSAATGADVSLVECRIGNMQVRSEVRETTQSAADAGLGHYANHTQAVADLAVDLDALGADAEVSLGSADSAGGGRPVTMVDAFVVALQVGQVLLYELDGVDRARSNTLWMRRTTMSRATAPSRTPDRFRIRASLEGASLVHARGGRWRTATIVADCHGVQTRCAVAHELRPEVEA